MVLNGERSFYIVLPVVRVSSWNPYIMSDAREPSVAHLLLILFSPLNTPERSHRSLKQTNTSSHILSSSEPGSVARLTLAPRQAHGDTAPCIARPGTRLVEACSNAAVSERAERILCWGRTHIGGPRRGFHAPAAGIGVCWVGGGRPSRCLRSRRSAGSAGRWQGRSVRRADGDSACTKPVRR
ncbi:hypothetical protein EDB85DRAFT_2001596 [Lactarius pseudohatsudake]|nr:hypothetical protein EDB85DRAFT_2001596 [Lactarius pseudohatsudake]